MHLYLKRSLYFLSAFIALLAILVGVYWSTLKRFQKLYFPFDIPKSLNLNQCRYLDKSLFGCEDIEIIGDYAVIACGNQNGRSKWWPPLFRYNVSTESDTVFAYDFIEKRLENLKLLRHPTNHLSLHGISAFPGAKENKIVIGLINHRKEGSCVELYDHRVGTNEMIYKEQICDPLIHHPNSLALTSMSSFYLTNTWASHVSPSQGALMSLLRGHPGDLVYRSEQGRVNVVKSNLITPNGVAVMGSYVYVVLTGLGQVLVMERNSAGGGSEGGRVRTSTTVVLPSIPDNVFVVKETGQLVVTGMLHASPLVKWFRGAGRERGRGMGGGGPPKVPSGIFTVFNNTKKDSQFYGHRFVVSSVVLDPDSKWLNVPSIAAVHWPSKKMLVGGPLMKGLVECDWPTSIKEVKN